MTLRNLVLLIEYDGTDFHGWQRQKGDRSVQAEIEGALARVIGAPVTLTGSGRTDAGVHALAQTANFHCDSRLKPEIFQKALNSLLSDDIRIHACADVPPDFHARFDVIDKTYHYRILNRPRSSPLNRRQTWHISQPLNLSAMNRAAALLMGEHDFKSFEGSGSPRAHTVRRVFTSQFIAEPDGSMAYHIRANGFLRYMVRNIVGTLVAVGRGRISPETVLAILKKQDRTLAGATAPAHGLTLVQVSYPPPAGEILAGLDHRACHAGTCG